MAVVRLSAGGTRQLPEGGVLEADCTVVRGPAAAVQLVVERVAEPGAAAPAVQRLGPHRLLVHALPGPARVVARPASGELFPEGLVLQAQVRLRLGGADSGSFVLPGGDVSSTRELELCRLTPGAGTWTLAVPAAADVRGGEDRRRPRGSPPLPPGPPEGGAEDGPAVRARNAARRLAGGPGLPDDARRELHVAVDCSGSMQPALRTGAVQALLEVLVGVNEVVGTAGAVPVWELRALPRRVDEPLTLETVDGYAQRALAPARVTTGARLAPLVREAVLPHPRRSLVVVTDGVPGDLHALVPLLSSAGAGRVHLVVLGRGPDSAAAREARWRDELAPLAPALAAGLTVSSVEPGRGPDWLPRRLESRAELEAVVAGVVPWPAPVP